MSRKAVYVLTFSGRKGSGKDTAADQALDIVEQHTTHQPTKRVAFADSIAHQVCELLGIEYDQYDTVKRINTTIEYAGGGFRFNGREIVRGIGMMMRSYDENQFTRYVMSELESFVTAIADDDEAGSGVFAITDMRFENEIDMVKFLDGATVGPTYAEAVDIVWVPIFVECMESNNDEHVTEQLQYRDLRMATETTMTVPNNRTVQDLRHDIEQVLRYHDIISSPSVWQSIKQYVKGVV